MELKNQLQDKHEFACIRSSYAVAWPLGECCVACVVHVSLVSSPCVYTPMSCRQERGKLEYLPVTKPTFSYSRLAAVETSEV